MASYLTFEDPSNIGKDYSGNGNDFTATGFDLTPPGIFSTGLISSTGTFSGDPANAFDGNPITLCGANSTAAGTTIRWAPSTPFHFTQKVEVVVNGENTASYGSEPAVQGIGGTYITLYTGSGTIDAANPIISYCNPGSSYPYFYAFRIDGVVLVDNTGTDYDLMQDSPTQNFATLNPLQTYRSGVGDPVYSNANLRASQQVSATSTIGMPVNSGVYYWEGTWDNANNSTDYMGIALQPLGAGVEANGFTGWGKPNTGKSPGIRTQR